MRGAEESRDPSLRSGRHPRGFCAKFTLIELEGSE
jgi:hypothetical protein